MGGGDLNLKKSWHPLLMKNQERVWQEEKKALDERRKTEQVRKEREEERQLQELQKLQEAAGGKKRQVKVDWMYDNGPSGTGQGVSEEMEGYLLGKTRIDQLLKSKQSEELNKLQKDSGTASFQGPAAIANPAKDLASKMRDDPLMAMKAQEQAALDRLMAEARAKAERDGGRRERHGEHGRDGRDDRDRHRRDGHHRHRHAHRDHDRERRHRDDDHGHHLHHRRRDDRDEERSSRRHRHSERRRHDSRSAERSYHDDKYRSRKLTPPTSRSRSRSPRGDSYSKRRRSRSPLPGRSEYRREREAPPAPRIHQQQHDRQSRDDAKEDEERARKLAAMQASAGDLEAQRRQRIEEVNQRDASERERDLGAKFDRNGFVSGLNRQVGAMGMSETMRRGAGSMAASEE